MKKAPIQETPDWQIKQLKRINKRLETKIYKPSIIPSPWEDVLSEMPRQELSVEAATYCLHHLPNLTSIIIENFEAQK